jgi:hypothetical protein
MDEDYRKIGRSFVHLGEALETVCRSVGSGFENDPRMVIMRESAFRCRVIGTAVEREEPQAVTLVSEAVRCNLAPRFDAAASTVEFVGTQVEVAKIRRVALPLSTIENAGAALVDIEAYIPAAFPGDFIADVLPGDAPVIGRPRKEPKTEEPSPEPAETAKPVSDEGGRGLSSFAEYSLNQAFSSLIKDFDSTI